MQQGAVPVSSRVREVQPTGRMVDAEGYEYIPVDEQPSGVDRHLCDKHTSTFVVMLLCHVKNRKGERFLRKEWFCPAAHEHR